MTTENVEQPKGTDVASQAIEQQGGAAAPAGEGAQASPQDKPNSSFANEDAELARLLAEQAKLDDAAKAQGAQPGQPAQPAQPGTQPAATTAPTGQEKAAAQAKSSSESAIIALRRKLAQEQNARLILEGENRALKAITGQGNVEQPAANAGDGQGTEGQQQGDGQQDPLAAIDDQYMAIAEKVDNGELSQREAELERSKLRTQERELLEARARQQIEDTTTIEVRRNDESLKQHTERLVETYPVLKSLSFEQLERFVPMAYEQAAAEGKPIAHNTLQGDKDLRERMARMAESVYDPQRAASRGTGTAAVQGQPKPGNGTQPAPASQPTAAQREAKLQMQGNMPPDISRMGTGAQAGELSEEAAAAQLAAFGGDSDAAIRFLDANPNFVQKVMGRSMRVGR